MGKAVVRVPVLVGVAAGLLLAGCTAPAPSLSALGGIARIRLPAADGDEALRALSVPPPPAAPAEPDTELCRTVRNLYVIDGRETLTHGRYCFRDGQWVAS